MDETQFLNEKQRQMFEASERIKNRASKWAERQLEKMSIGGGRGGLYKYDIERKIHECSSLSFRYKSMHNFFQIFILIGAAVVPFFFNNIPDMPKLIPTILSLGVALAAIIEKSFKFGERSQKYHLAAEELQQEYNWYETDRGFYKNASPEDAVAHFMDTTETIMHKYDQHILSLASLERCSETLSYASPGTEDQALLRSII